MSDLSQKFCLAPFRNFETLIDGNVSCCCSLWMDCRLGNIDTQSFDQIWNSDEAQKIRQSIHDGSFRHCRKDRCSYLIHDTLPDRNEIIDPYYRRIIDERVTKLDRGPAWLVLGHDVTCNLSCPSCRSDLLAADEAQEARLERILETVVKPAVGTRDASAITLSGQGDPWASKHYLSILRLLANNDLDIKLYLNTNGLLMTPARWEQYKGLEKYRPVVNVSVDACRPWSFEVIRRNGNWEKLLPNLQFIGELRGAGKVSEYYLNATVQTDNFHEMADMVRLGKNLGCDAVRFCHIQHTGAHLDGLFHEMNVADDGHPLHLAFLESLRDPIFDDPICSLCEVEPTRDGAKEKPLPSDMTNGVGTEETCVRTVNSLIGENRLSEAAGLTAYARIHYPDSYDLKFLDGVVLQTMGFPLQASYRYREIIDQHGDNPHVRLPLGTALFEVGRREEAVRCLIEACLRAPDQPEIHTVVAKFLSANADEPPLWERRAA